MMTYLEKNRISLGLAVFIILISIIAYPVGVSAATFYFETEIQPVIDRDVAVMLLMDAEEQYINALEGTIIIPEDFFEIINVHDGNSIINFWIERPRVQDNKVTFSGIIPGGFNGIQKPFESEKEAGVILTIIARPKLVGSGSLYLEGLQALINDGKGTPAPITEKSYSLHISETLTEKIVLPIPDKIPPEPFQPIIAQNHSVFEGKYFLVFSTSDKDSGISYYEVLEERPLPGFLNQFRKKSEWIPAESPHLLKDQLLKSIIKVKAVDGEGNIRIAELAPKFSAMGATSFFVYSGVLFISLFILLTLFIFLSRNIKK